MRPSDKQKKKKGDISKNILSGPSVEVRQYHQNESAAGILEGWQIGKHPTDRLTALTCQETQEKGQTGGKEGTCFSVRVLVYHLQRPRARDRAASWQRG